MLHHTKAAYMGDGARVRKRCPNERANEGENRGRRRIHIVQIYSRLDFGSLPILFSRAKAGSHCARANFVTDCRALSVCVWVVVMVVVVLVAARRFRSRAIEGFHYTREKVSRSILRR